MKLEPTTKGGNCEALQLEAKMDIYIGNKRTKFHVDICW